MGVRPFHVCGRRVQVVLLDGGQEDDDTDTDTGLYHCSWCNVDCTNIHLGFSGTVCLSVAGSVEKVTADPLVLSSLLGLQPSDYKGLSLSERQAHLRSLVGLEVRARFYRGGRGNLCVSVLSKC